MIEWWNDENEFPKLFILYIPQILIKIFKITLNAFLLLRKFNVKNTEVTLYIIVNIKLFFQINLYTMIIYLFI